ncbi:MAG: hypothetical protein AAF465_13470 [Pseudomonadota bacterium]
MQETIALKDRIVAEYTARRQGCLSPFMTVNGIGWGTGFGIAYSGEADRVMHNAAKLLLHMARLRIESESTADEFEAAIEAIVDGDDSDLKADARVLVSCIAG